ncbi:hypothetical protein GEV33_004822 [Tenebrio molitor]|uniref:Uncharacterized protein n=1 Tax=Tenebrio molitor TaxID=7067 RepID=A0A8J6HQT1_TENMO|nr:hypothetical protein GEV33_004822 [Tenebrio molitor]
MVLKSKLVSMTGEKTKLFLNKLPRYFFSFGSAAGNSLGAGSKGKVNLTQNDKEKGRQDPPAALRREYPDPIFSTLVLLFSGGVKGCSRLWSFSPEQRSNGKKEYGKRDEREGRDSQRSGISAQVEVPRYTNGNYGNGTENHSTFGSGYRRLRPDTEIGDVQATMAAKCTQ